MSAKKKVAVWYLCIGLAWGAFATYKGYEVGNYQKYGWHYAPATLVVNTITWPVALPVGIWVIAKGKKSLF
ncbi:MAG: hypothetical protein HYT27_02860 [Parcubacteria group bacterium]|nr:hypothetical protein [Parcubacteria group bacterium]